MGKATSMFHMDLDYMWRWFLTNAAGRLVGMSTQSFFSIEEAQLDLRAALGNPDLSAD
jgi:hypothetical protein